MKTYKCKNKNCEYTGKEIEFVLENGKVCCPKCGYRKVEEVK